MRSLNARVLVAAGVVLAAFLGSAGWVLDQAFRDTAMTSVKDRLQGQIFMLLGMADLAADAQVVVNAVLPDSQLLMPDSGHYAQIIDAAGKPVWRSRSMLGRSIQAPSERAPGRFVFDELDSPADGKLYSLSYTVVWERTSEVDAAVYTVQACEDITAYLRQVGRFRRSLWLWFVGIGIVLMVVQTAILRWGLKPLRDVAAEVREIEAGAKSALSGAYPSELSSLTTNLNALIHNSRSSVQRYRNALGDLAHSLKTPLAVLRSTLETKTEGTEMTAIFSDQLDHLDATIQYQLQRAAAAGRQALGRPVEVRGAAEKIVNSLTKVYADRHLAIDLRVVDGIRFFGDQGDLLEILGNVADNACKWANSRIEIEIKNQQTEITSSRPPLSITISDDGPGMPSDQIRAVLERGTRLDQATEGQGIGLAIVRELVEEIYRGSIFIRSARGKTTVSMTLNFS